MIEKIKINAIFSKEQTTFGNTLISGSEWTSTESKKCNDLLETSNKSVTTEDIVFAVYYGGGIFLISIICLIGNILIIRAILTSKKLKGAHNWFVLSLAFSDILQGLTIPFYTLGHSVKVPIFTSLGTNKNR